MSPGDARPPWPARNRLHGRLQRTRWHFPWFISCIPACDRRFSALHGRGGGRNQYFRKGSAHPPLITSPGLAPRPGGAGALRRQSAPTRSHSHAFSSACRCGIRHHNVALGVPARESRAARRRPVRGGESDDISHVRDVRRWHSVHAGREKLADVFITTPLVGDQSTGANERQCGPPPGPRALLWRGLPPLPAREWRCAQHRRRHSTFCTLLHSARAPRR
jgi:hypothetical protein